MDAQKFNHLLKSITVSKNSFNELYQFYGRRIVFHLSSTYGSELAKDVSHEFFLKLITSNKEYEYIEKPTSWVYKCCENIAKTKIKTDSKYCSICTDAEYREKFFDNLELKPELDKIDSVSRKIIELYYWDGFNLKEIAEILNINYATVRQRHSRAKIKLKKILKELSQN